MSFVLIEAGLLFKVLRYVESVYMRFENDDVRELCRAYPPVFIVGVDVTQAVDDADARGDTGSGEYDGIE